MAFTRTNHSIGYDTFVWSPLKFRQCKAIISDSPVGATLKSVSRKLDDSLDQSTHRTAFPALQISKSRISCISFSYFSR